jgi:hypothetical protein
MSVLTEIWRALKTINRWCWEVSAKLWGLWWGFVKIAWAFMYGIMMKSWLPFALACAGPIALFNGFKDMVTNGLNQLGIAKTEMIDLATESMTPPKLLIGSLDVMNIFIPLDEVASYFLIILPLLVVAATIRMIKAFIPTIS